MGGIHPTIMCEQVLEHWPVDIIVLGEGEETIKELMICLEGNRLLGMSTVLRINIKAKL